MKMAEALYLREADGNHLILNQRDKYDEIQIVSLNRNRELRRGGGTMSDKDLSGLVRDFLNFQKSDESETVLTIESIELTERVRDRLGKRMVYWMTRSNQGGCLNADDLLRGMENALEILGIPFKEHWDGENDLYIGIDIAGKTFYSESGDGNGNES